jgi:hypothetical protein
MQFAVAWHTLSEESLTWGKWFVEILLNNVWQADAAEALVCGICLLTLFKDSILDSIRSVLLRETADFISSVFLQPVTEQVTCTTCASKSTNKSESFMFLTYVGNLM